MKSLLKNSPIQYLTAFVLVLFCSFSFTQNGFAACATILLVYGIIPLLEWKLPIREKKISDSLEQQLLDNSTFDSILFLIVPCQYLLLFQFLNRVTSNLTSPFEAIVLTITMGIACGVLGINVAHELGHRTQKLHQTLSSSLLLTSLYMHFTIEHNKGHHKNVATPEDPSTARLGESVYSFWLRCIPQTFRSAWAIEAKELNRKKKSEWSFKNKMIKYLLIQACFIVFILFFFGLKGMLFFMAAAFIGILHLETVNYIEHYGLMRKLINEYRYENVQVWHSWNNNRIIGRLFLFDLTLHSDHHHKVHKHYQILQSTKNSPQLPLGYPSAMLLSLLPTFWFRTMHPLIEELNQQHNKNGKEHFITSSD